MCSPLTLLVLHAALRVWALWVALCAITVLLGAVDLLRLRVLTGLASSLLIPYWRQLGPTHLRLHHVWLAVLARLALCLRVVLTVPLSVLACAFFVLLARRILLLLLGLPFFADFLELCMVAQVSMHAG